MKKLIVAPLLIGLLLLIWGFLALTHAQAPGTDLKPTFISPTPGLYVNGWPAFTISYRKDWVNLPSPGPFTVFQVMGVRPNLPPSPMFTVGAFPNPFPVQEWAKFVMPLWVTAFTDIKILSDKPTRLADGAPGWEVEVEFVPKAILVGDKARNAPKSRGLLVMAKRGMTWIQVWVSDEGGIGEDLRKVVYSLTFQPERERPVDVPPDVRAFLDMWCTDRVSRGMETVMGHVSDRFSHNGVSKTQWKQQFGIAFSPFRPDITSCEPTVTVFELRGDRAFIDGFLTDKGKGDGNEPVALPLTFQQIINEHGQWKWYGNQK